MKVLFLDIDGVLNSEEHFYNNHIARTEAAHKDGDDKYNDINYIWPLGHLSEDLINYLNMIVEMTGCHIVISSTWRIGNTPEQIGKYLKVKGFLYASRIIDCTGQDSKNARGGEIQNWLDEHPEVTQYVILDDDSADIIGDYTTKKHPKNFVHTDFMWGLQDVDVEQAIKILNRPLINCPSPTKVVN